MSRAVKVQLVVALAALVLVSLMVVRASSAAFSDTSDNPGNSWTAGTVVIDDGQGGTAVFSAGAMAPGDSVEACFDVVYSGTVTATSGVSFYVSDLVDTDSGAGGDAAATALSDDLDVDVQLGALGEVCGAVTGTPLHTAVALDSLPTTFAGGATGWTPTASSDRTRAFRITVTLGSDTLNDAQGDTATATFTWEAQS